MKVYIELLEQLDELLREIDRVPTKNTELAVDRMFDAPEKVAAVPSFVTRLRRPGQRPGRTIRLKSKSEDHKGPDHSGL